MRAIDIREVEPTDDLNLANPPSNRDLLDYLAENGFDPQYGARPLKRLIQKEIVNTLSKKILAGAVDKTHPVLVDVFDGVVVFRNEVEQHV